MLRINIVIRIFLLSLLCLIMIQCTSERNTRIRLGNITQLEPQEILHYSELGNVLSMHKVEDNFFVSFYRDTLCLGVLDSAMNVLYRFGRRGRAANELLAPCLTGQYKRDLEGVIVPVFERTNNQLFYYHIDNVGYASLVNTEMLPREYGDMRIVYKISPYDYWGIIDNKSQDIFFYNRGNNELTFYNINNRQKDEDYQTMVTAREGLNAFALAYYSLPRIDILGDNGEFQKSVEIVGLDNMDNITERNDYFLDICSTDEYIYALIAYNDEKDLLFKIDWNGNYEGLYEICDSELLCVDDNAILCMNYDENGLIVANYPISFLNDK